jgi:hypothetical protein
MRTLYLVWDYISWGRYEGWFFTAASAELNLLAVWFCLGDSTTNAMLQVASLTKVTMRSGELGGRPEEKCHQVTLQRHIKLASVLHRVMLREECYT